MLIGIGYFGWLIAAFIFANNGLRYGSLLISSRERNLEFRKRIGARIWCLMMCVWILAFIPVFGWINASNATVFARRHQSFPVWHTADYFSLLGTLCLTLPFAVLLFYLAGPNDLFLNLDRHSYRFVSGWPICSQTQVGTWEDIAGVYVKQVSGSRSGVSYLVGIAWRQERRNFPLLGRFRREQDAEALAEEVSASLGLPRVLPPPLGKTSVDPVSQQLPIPLVTHPYRPFQSTLFSEDVAAEPKPDK